MKMRTFYKNSNLILIKNSNLKYELYKKKPFLELLETPAQKVLDPHWKSPLL